MQLTGLGLNLRLLFRQVGLVSIAAGLLLSILYYAIPVEPPASKRNPRPRLSLWKRIKQKVKLERVLIPIPNFPKRKLVFVGTPLIAAIVGYSANMILLQQPVNAGARDALDREERLVVRDAIFAGIDLRNRDDRQL